MGLTSQRTKPGLLEHPALWDVDVLSTPTSGAPGDRLPNNRPTNDHPPDDRPPSDHPPNDHLANFSGPIVNVRWATTAVSAVLAGNEILQPDWLMIGAIVAVLANTIYRSIAPLVYTGSPLDQLLLLGEVVAVWILVSITGFWDSPLILATAGILVVAGFAGGFRMALRISGAFIIGLTMLHLGTSEWTSSDFQDAMQWSTLLLLTSVTAGYSLSLIHI